MSSERGRNEQVSLGPEPFGDPFVSTAGQGGNVDVVHGVYAHSMPLGGMRVRDARAELEERMNIDPDAVALIDGQEVDEETVLAEGQTLNFIKHAGEKGRSRQRPERS
jgi:hypothetical protein